MATQVNSRREYHPAVSISSWLILAAAVELASPRQLPWLVMSVALLLIHVQAWKRFLVLLWKAKWLWLAIMLLYSLTIPGIYVWPGMQGITYEGLQAGGLRVIRLVSLLAALARLLEEFSPQQLAGGIFLLSRPLEVLGFDRRALAVRLALTIELLEVLPQNKNWLEALKSSGNEFSGPEEMRFDIPPLGLADAGLLAAACILLGMCLS